MKPVTHNTNSSSRITPMVFLKLVAVLALILGVGVLTKQFYWTIICLGAALGMFLAEHFASTRAREFLFLICLPAVLGCVAMILLSSWGSAGFGAAETGLWTLMTLLLGIVPAALSVVGLSILSLIVFKLTGLRLLKFEWNLATERVVEN